MNFPWGKLIISPEQLCRSWLWANNQKRRKHLEMFAFHIFLLINKIKIYVREHWDSEACEASWFFWIVFRKIPLNFRLIILRLKIVFFHLKKYRYSIFSKASIKSPSYIQLNVDVVVVEPTHAQFFGAFRNMLNRNGRSWRRRESERKINVWLKNGGEIFYQLRSLYIQSLSVCFYVLDDENILNIIRFFSFVYDVVRSGS